MNDRPEDDEDAEEETLMEMLAREGFVKNPFPKFDPDTGERLEEWVLKL